MCQRNLLWFENIFISNSAVLDTKELIHKYKFFGDTMRSYIHGNSAEGFDLSS